MNRKIKFRMWDFENKAMVDGDSLAFEEYAPISHLLSQKGIMQFTGLTDRNGKEIYEGDVVHCAISEADRSGFIRDFTATVQEDICNPCFVLKQENGWVEYDFVMCGLMILEVIGNIYANPELVS